MPDHHRTDYRGPLRLAVLASGTGTNLQAILDASDRGSLDAEVVVVVSDRRDALALERARRHGIEALWVNPRDFASREEHDRHLVDLLTQRRVELVVLAGYMRLLTPLMVRAFPWRVMNIHPALLPSFPGKDGLTPAIDHGVKVTGPTVHFVDEGTDSGPIILQAAVTVYEGDTRETLAERVHVQEHRIYTRAIKLFAEGRLRVVDGRRVEVLPRSAVATRGRGTGGRRRRRALLSLHEKTGLEELARGLVAAGFELVSSGGTARAIRDAGLPVLPVDNVTGFPELLDGRVKTLHPAVHGGILARRDLPEHLDQIDRLGIEPIDLVAVNLYPFQETVNREALFPEVVENIDIGGPTLIRAAAKNHADVIVLTDPSQYGPVLELLEATGDVPEPVRRQLALAAFRHTAFYDSLIAGYLGEVVADAAPAGQPFPDRIALAFEKVADLRYGENPHQAAAFYRQPLRPLAARLGAVFPWAEQLQGKDLSYNNIADAEAALRAVEELDEGPQGPAAAVAVKHLNPCGAAVAPDILTAYRRTFESDPVSIFGGIVALNRPVDALLAQEMVKVFLEVILAPAFTPEALEVFRSKAGIRLLALPVAAGRPPAPPAEARTVPGGLLIQTPDHIQVPPSAWKAVTSRAPSEAELRDLLFAWRVCKHVKSNAIAVARAGQLLGVGAGQMNRIDSTRLALGHASRFFADAGGARGAVLASDAFFPFPDSVEAAAEAGISAIVQPGGSLKDQEAIRVCNEAGMAMVLTGERHFRH